MNVSIRTLAADLDVFRHNLLCFGLQLQVPPVVEWDSSVIVCWTGVDVDWEHTMHIVIENEIIQQPRPRTIHPSVDSCVCSEEAEDLRLSCGSGESIAAAVVDGRNNPDDDAYADSQPETEMRDESRYEYN